jgi:hypothetical protein
MRTLIILVCGAILATDGFIVKCVMDLSPWFGLFWLVTIPLTIYWIADGIKDWNS